MLKFKYYNCIDIVYYRDLEWYDGIYDGDEIKKYIIRYEYYKIVMQNKWIQRTTNSI